MPALRPPYVLALGVMGKDGIGSPLRGRALAAGKKIPAPGMSVEKYDTLHSVSPVYMLKQH